MDPIQIIGYELSANRYNGLFVEDACACEVDDVAPCGGLADKCCLDVLIDIESCGNCTKRHQCDFHIGPKPNEEDKALQLVT